LELLADLYVSDPKSPDLRIGDHGPEQVAITNPVTTWILNRFAVTWTIQPVADPRPGRAIRAIQILVTVTPVNTSNTRNYRALFNKAVAVSTVLSEKTTS
jgi:hypothetical protein